jgi:hypothetical protein
MTVKIAAANNVAKIFRAAVRERSQVVPQSNKQSIEIENPVESV